MAARGRDWTASLLYPFRPRFRNWRFWTVQWLVLFIAAAANTPQHIPMALSVTLYFLPVTYAALNFGIAGSVATALWCTLLTVAALPRHPDSVGIDIVFQLLAINGVAVFAGQRVEREKAARRQAESVQEALRVSEAKYRGLFESSPVPLLLVEGDGRVLDANPAGGLLFERPVRGLPLSDLLGPAAAGELLAAGRSGRASQPALTWTRHGGPDVWLEPIVTRSVDSEHGRLQVLLWDVTQERLRQEGLKAYAGNILRGQEEERRRIAQELHDETIQALIILYRQLDALQDPRRELPAELAKGLGEAQAYTAEVVETLREFTRRLRPSTLDELGLVASIRRLVADLQKRTGAAGRFHVAGDERRLPAEVELGVYRIAQEALHNVERHARPTEVSLRLGFHTEEVRLTVADNGVGFDLPPRGDFAVGGGRLGLLGMRERTALLGGTLRIRSHAGHGTQLRLRVPV